VKVVLAGLDTRNVAFDLDDVCVDPVNSGAEGLVEHDDGGKFGKGDPEAHPLQRRALKRKPTVTTVTGGGDD
jgi:hypothetical protein